MNTENVASKEIRTSNLHTHASIISRLGEELIADEITAFSELIKNCYDADSPYAKFNVDCAYTGTRKVEIKNASKIYVKEYSVSGKIIIEDKGNGMSLDEIENGWLTISNSTKKHMKENKIKTKKGRIPLGEKGLGRLSLQRLGNFTTLITKKEYSDIEYTVEIPWLLYNEDLTLEDVDIIIRARQVEYDERGYTTIIIYDLKNKELWYDEKNLKEFEKSLMQITSPFGKNYRFNIQGVINSHKIDSELISKALLDKNRSMYEISLDNQKLSITGKFGMEMFFRGGKCANVLDVANYFNSTYFKLKDNFIYDKVNNKVEISVVYDDVKDIGGVYEISKYYPGDFKAKIYDFNLDNNYFKEYIRTTSLNILSDLTSYRNAIKKYHGMYIIRDNFTIFPYGFDGKDWLGISTAKNTSMSTYALKNDTIIGYIELDGDNNANLKEKTDREGFINNVYYSNFICIVSKAFREISLKIDNLIRGFNKYNNNLRDNSSDKRPTTTEEAIDSVDKVLSGLKKEVKNNNIEKEQIDLWNGRSEAENKETTESVETKADYIKMLENSTQYLKRALDEQNERIDVLANLAGLGLVSEAIAHDMMNILANFEAYSDKIKKRINNKQEIDLNDFISYINSVSGSLRKEISHISPSFTVVKDKKEVIDMKIYVEKIMEFYKKRFDKKNIELSLVGDKSFTININRGQLNQVFDNLILNSEYWLSKYIKEEGVTSAFLYVNILEEGIIRIWDSGYGVSENREEDLFYPFVTDKVEGRGLGLYIVQSILSNNGAQIELLSDRNIHNRRYVFQMQFAI